jgi:hypothetical protein
MRRVAVVSLGVAAAGAAFAQSRPAAAPVAAVVRVQRADVARARARLAAHQSGIARCLADARTADPGPLEAVRFIDATIALDRAGAAVSVEFVPPLLSRGLSACMAEALLDWSQGGVAGPAGAVVLRIAPR